MKWMAALFAVLQLALVAGPVNAQQSAAYPGGVRTVTTQSWVEEWDAASGQWVRVSEIVEGPVQPNAAMPSVTATYVNGQLVSQVHSAARYAQPITAESKAQALARYGPFLVASATRVVMVGSTDAMSPRHFDAMLRDFPGIALLEMVEAPGTNNDIANLAVGRRIREAGIATHVPRGGSVRSGAVELFLAGSTRTLEEGARFAVHSWLDTLGREADDFAADHAAHRLYLDYYVEMGMSEAQARDFYAMTNSVPHHSALWLGAADMRPWLGRERADPVVVAQPARMAPPAASPSLALDWRRFEQKPVLPVLPPMLPYVDLTWISLASLEASRLDTILDSRSAFS
jgi:hypothetical protein